MSSTATVSPNTFVTRPLHIARQPDSEATASLSAGTAKSGGERDYRLDFWRGVALIVIFIDHIPNNPLSYWTLRNFAFCDAAEVFVLISGISSYLAYASKLDRDGMGGLAVTTGRRWIKIYAAHLFMLLSVASVLLLTEATMTELPEEKKEGGAAVPDMGM